MTKARATSDQVHSIMAFIDIHNHIIPFVDDGADDWETALTMLRGAEADGIVELVATPHIHSPAELQEEARIVTRFDEITKRATDAGMTIKLHLGAELLVQPGYDFTQRTATPAQNGRYFLTEFHWDGIPDLTEARFFELFPDGFVPIIAHPEQNPSIIKDPSKAVRFHEKGALLQVTGGSLLGAYGSQIRAVAHELMNRDVVQIVATDAHDLTERTLKLGPAFEYVSREWGAGRAEMLFCVNPRRVINGENINTADL